MGEIREKMCEWEKKDIAENLADLIAIVRKPRYVCKDCGRVAASKKLLCKAYKIGPRK
jgi:hypothetical protein